MKREIKFRGQRVDNGEWVYGDYHHRAGGVQCIIRMEPDDNGKAVYIVHQVDPDTVGQFTGLLDKNGKEIYEGDIMRIPETEFNIEIIGVVEFDRGSYVVRSFFSGTNSSLAWAVRERQPGERRSVVIGNIHDNPELVYPKSE